MSCNIHDEGKFDHRMGCTCERPTPLATGNAGSGTKFSDYLEEAMASASPERRELAEMFAAHFDAVRKERFAELRERLVEMDDRTELRPGHVEGDLFGTEEASDG